MGPADPISRNDELAAATLGLTDDTVLRRPITANRDITKRAGHGGHVPIVAMTAYAMKEDRDRCLAAGADGYIAKPVRAAELIAAVEEVARQKQGV